MLAEYNRLLERVSVDPGVCGGKPVIQGTRIWVTQLLDYLAEGMSVAEVLEEYPYITEEDVLAAIAHGAEAIRQVHHDLYDPELGVLDGAVRVSGLNGFSLEDSDIPEADRIAKEYRAQHPDEL